VAYYNSYWLELLLQQTSKLSLSLCCTFLHSKNIIFKYMQTIKYIYIYIYIYTISWHIILCITRRRRFVVYIFRWLIFVYTCSRGLHQCICCSQCAVYTHANSSLAYTKSLMRAPHHLFTRMYTYISLSFPLTDRCNALENCILSSCIYIIIIIIISFA